MLAQVEFFLSNFLHAINHIFDQIELKIIIRLYLNFIWIDNGTEWVFSRCTGFYWA